MRRFELHRDIDVSGVSGVGVVAAGWTLPFGLGAVLKWRTPTWSVSWYPRAAWIERIHGHGGATRFVWLDGG